MDIQRPPTQARRRSPSARARLSLVVLVVAAAAVYSRLGDEYLPAGDANPSRHATVAVFGATGLIGEGVLDAMLRNPGVRAVHVVTRRRTPAIDTAATTGRVTVWTHRDFLDYWRSRRCSPMSMPCTGRWGRARSMSPTRNTLGFTSTIQCTSWAHGSRRGRSAPLSFHLVSGSGASRRSWFHWAREKARAEQALFETAAGTGLR